MARDIKFQMMLSAEEAKALDDYQFGNRIKSRAEAIRSLIRAGHMANEMLAVLKMIEEWFGATNLGNLSAEEQRVIDMIAVAEGRK